MTDAGVHRLQFDDHADTAPNVLKDPMRDGSEKPPTPDSLPDLDIVDIRRDVLGTDLKAEITRLLRPEHGPKRLPTLLLYDEKGLQLFEQITYLDEYYLTNAEIDVLNNHAADIARNIQSGTMIIELGSGNLRKVSVLLQALDKAGKDVDYYALDLSISELERTLSAVPSFLHVRCHGLHGTYDDGLEWLKSGKNASRPKCILSLGSSIGNFEFADAADFLKGWAQILGPSDTFLLGIDATCESQKVYHAYNDREGVTHRFILNGLRNANSILGEKVFHLDDWDVIGEFVFSKEGGKHQAFYAPNKDVTCLGVKVHAGERIQVEKSLKFSKDESQALWRIAGVKEVNKWAASHDDYSLHLLINADPTFSMEPAVYAATTVPTLDEWRGLWSTWDAVTRGMIPDDELSNKPIKLRNACIFYLGHIPTFLDMQVNKANGEPLCEPSYYPSIFERGIDPDVDNPENCHAHSEIPDEWPPLHEILAHQSRVRAKVENMYATGDISRRLGRCLWLGFEHEVMHLETLLYMLVQSDRTLPPPRTQKPDFVADAKLAEEAGVSNKWFTIPEQEILVGLEDPEDDSGPDAHFGWDNEKPSRTVMVPSFQAKARPITNEEYALYLVAVDKTNLPASWFQEKAVDPSHAESSTRSTESSGTKLTSAYLKNKMVRTVWGCVPLQYALHWPVFASYDELVGCARWMGGRIPTVEETRSIYSHADGLRVKEAEQHLGKTVPAVNSHLVNNGVQESPPQGSPKRGESSQELFADLKGANVGFTNWHPVAVNMNGNKLAGRGEMGGVWEWTSSPLTKHEGFEPMSLYPAYTADFFDGKHNVVLGGSWATHPRIAGRKTFVNWYQRNYPYAWCGARLVRDL